jgi:hypothetical protein
MLFGFMVMFVFMDGTLTQPPRGFNASRRDAAWAPGVCRA